MRVMMPLVPQAWRISWTASPSCRTTRGSASMVTTSRARTVSKSRRLPCATEPMPPGTAAEESADRSFDDGRGIAAQLPACLARFVFEHAQAHAGLADGDAVRLDRFDLVHARQVEHHAAMQRNRLAVVARARAAHGHRKIVGMAVAQHVLNLRRAVSGCTTTSPTLPSSCLRSTGEYQ